MSVVLDAHWWWRAEFGGKTNPYLESENADAQESNQINPFMSTVNDAAVEEPTMTIDPSLLPSFLDDDMPNWNMDMSDFGLGWF